MALTDSEVQRIRFELGYPNLDTAAEPYIGITAYFEQILKPYLLAGASTTSSTPVTATDSPTPQSLVLGSVDGMAVGNVIVIDVDARQERATIQNISSSSVTVQLLLAHTGTYPVTIEGGESLIRDILKELRLLTSGMNGASSAYSSFRSRAGIKAIVGEVEFFGGGNTLASQGIDPLTQINQLREFWRDELANALGIRRLNGKNAQGGGSVSVY